MLDPSEIASRSCRQRWVGLALGLLIASCGTKVTRSADPAPLPADHAERLAKGTELFQTQISALLKQHCLKCHGGTETKGELNLVTREGLLKGGETSPAVIPFDAKKSLLYKLITHAEEPPMPDKADKLPAEVIAQFAAWIDLGAPYDKPLLDQAQIKPKERVVTDEDKKWWSFQPLKKVTPPATEDPRAKNEIDQFIIAQAQTKKLTLADPATKRILIRRAYLDLIGLPPAPDDVTAFVRDDSPDAWPELIDRLLASRHYGERWARHWLDLARFAESHGFEQDYDRPGAWAYRDFLIKAFNADMPYKQFVNWQLAGDEFAPEDPLALSATGFLGAGVFPTQITANEVERTRYDALDDMVSTTSQAFLGLTVGCARCHDHKYDPIPTRDYYRLLSTFATTVRSNIEIDLDPDLHRPEHEKWSAQAKQLDAEAEKVTTDLQPKFKEWLSTEPANVGRAWQIVEIVKNQSTGGATFKKLDDDSYLVEGKNAPHDTYTVTAKTSLKQLAGLKLEALAHSSLPKNGPGRAPNGNFGLSRISVVQITADGEQPLKFATAEATFEQNDKTLSIASSLDNNPASGWAVDPQIGKDHAAAFWLEKPVEISKETTFQIKLEFAVNNQHQLGRFRLSASDARETPLTEQSLSASLNAVFQKWKQDGAAVLSTADQDSLFTWWKQKQPEFQAAERRIKDHMAKQPKTKTNIMICAEGYKPMRHHTQGVDFFNETFFLDRGNVDKKGDLATQSFLQVLMPNEKSASRWQWTAPEGAKYSGRRRSLANWINDAEAGAGALAARVIVNRVWQHHFGQGIVPTPSDFGKTGILPTHPELLDWLAGEFLRGGGSLKSLHKQIMLSAAYQQSTTPDRTKEMVDPNNTLLVRRLPRRLEAEPIRDSMLAVSGMLDQRMYGPGSSDEKSPRRSIYFTIKRSQLVGSLVVFDLPEPLVSQGNRPTTTVAPQALLVMNSPQVRTWAAAFARRVQTMTASDSYTPLVDIAFKLALCRLPTDSEKNESLQYLYTQTDLYTAQKLPDPRGNAFIDFCQALFGLNEFAYEE